MTEALPIQYLYLESVVFPIFLAIVLMFQLARSKDPGYYISDSRAHLPWLFAGFIILTVVFGGLLIKASPPLAIELAAGFILALLHPVNAFCLFIYLLFLRPWEIAVDNPLLLALPRVVALLCFFTWLIHPRQHGRPNARAWQSILLVLGFSLWLFLSTFGTPNVAGTQMDWFSIYFKSLIIFVMCLYFIESERSISEFQWTLVVSVLALMVIRLYQYHTEGPSLVRLETGGMFGDPNDLAAVIVLALPFALLPVLNRAATLGRQTLGLLFLALSVPVIWYSQSRGAMLAVAVQALTAGFLKSKGKKSLGTLLLAGVLGVGYFAAIKAIPRASEEMHASSESRITYWKTAVNMTLHHPMFGVGFDQYPDNYERYSSGVMYEWGRRTAHSSWLLAFAESGVLGGMLFLSFFLMTLRTAWRNRERWPDQFYALVGYGVVMSFLSHTYVMYIFLLTGLIMASDSLQNPVATGDPNHER